MKIDRRQRKFNPVSCLTLVVAAILLCSANTAITYENIAYIWQRAWKEGIKEAIIEARPEFRKFIVQCGDVKINKCYPLFTLIPVQWDYLKGKDTETILAFRMRIDVHKLLQAGKGKELAGSLIRQFAVLSEAARSRHIRIRGIQLDYDCPTGKLKDYADFVKQLKNLLPATELSITVLPVWLNDRNFHALVQDVSCYVLQLHSFAAPETIAAAANIFEQGKAVTYTSRASSFSKPFYVSLPTYGYEVAYDKNNRVLALRGESQALLLPPGSQRRVFVSNSRDVSAFVRKIRMMNVPKLLGICWYRLPIKTDEFNWSLGALKAVMNGEDPYVSMKVMIKAAKKGRYEVYLKNDGNLNLFQPVNFSITWKDRAVMLFDVQNHFEGRQTDGCRIEFTGMPPHAGKEIIIGWFRPMNGKLTTQPRASEVIWLNEKI